MALYMFDISKTDAAKFKKEYETLNGEKSPSGDRYQKLKISINNKVKYSNIEEAIEVLKGETALIYFGFSNCPWCRGMLPVLLDELDNSNLEEMLYVDMTDKRDEYKVSDGVIIEEKGASEDYYKLMNVLKKYLDDYLVKDSYGIEYEVGEKRLYVPLVVAVKEGVIQGVYNGIEYPEDQSPYSELTPLQKEEMQVIFTGLIESISETSTICDEHC